MDIKSIIGNYEFILDEIFDNLKKINIDFNDFEEVDHIAYRTETIEKYEELKNELIFFADTHSEVVFGGRKILVCRLKEPIPYNELKIYGIELLAPKENNTYKNGLEHVEIVTKNQLEVFKEKYSNLNFDLRAYDRKINPELILEFKNSAVKFHTESLLSIRKI